ncbi:MAG: hypothetical protein QHJ81_16400 [Anaerolineae bacterium]|nr:hypothetical protein [Anaerolineae bacterium]
MGTGTWHRRLSVSMASLLLATVAWAAGGLLAVPPAHAGSCSWTGNTSSDWHTGSNWSSGCSGDGGIPASDDDVLIPSGLSNQPIISSGDAAVNNLTINQNASLTVQGSRSLYIAGTFTKSGSFEAGSGTVVFNGPNGSIATGSTSFYDLRIASGATVNTSKSFNIQHSFTNEGIFTATDNTVNFVTGPTITLSGSGSTTFYNVKINSGKTVEAGSHSFAVSGSTWTNDGTFTAGTSTVTFNGSATQTISGATTFHNLTINNSHTSGDGVTLGADIIVNGTLTLSDGFLTLGSYNLTLGTGATVAGTPSASNMVVATGSGQLRKQFSGPGSFTFPVGDNTGTAEYSPATLNFTSGSFSGAYAAVSLADSKHANNRSPDYLTRYWTVTSSGISGFSCAATFKYTDADVVGTEANIKGAKWDSSWTVYDAVNAANNTFAMTVSSFSDFTGGSDPLLIMLASFTATPLAGAVLLEWETASEMDVAGFNIWRSASPDGMYVKLNSALIPARGSPTRGARYTYTDADIVPGTVYWYRLEEVDIYGAGTLHGPVIGTPRPQYRINLPFLALKR